MIESELKEAQCLLDSYDHCIDEDRAEKLKALAKEIIAPYLEIRNPKALWLESNMIGYGGDSGVSEEEFKVLWFALIKESADGNCPEAQYDYGCYLYERREYVEAVGLYKKSAYQGYRCAQWCFGLDTLNGKLTSQELQKCQNQDWEVLTGTQTNLE